MAMKREESLLYGEDGEEVEDSVGLGERHSGRDQPGCSGDTPLGLVAHVLVIRMLS